MTSCGSIEYHEVWPDVALAGTGGNTARFGARSRALALYGWDRVAGATERSYRSVRAARRSPAGPRPRRARTAAV